MNTILIAATYVAQVAAILAIAAVFFSIGTWWE